MRTASGPWSSSRRRPTACFARAPPYRPSRGGEPGEHDQPISARATGGTGGGKGRSASGADFQVEAGWVIGEEWRSLSLAQRVIGRVLVAPTARPESRGRRFPPSGLRPLL